MMNDHELNKAAAKAAGIEIHESDDGTMQRRPVWAMTHYVQGQPYGEHRWDPLNDDAQALRLAVALKLKIVVGNAIIMVERIGFPDVGQTFTDDPYAATRLAIVRAAAAPAPTF